MLIFGFIMFLAFRVFHASVCLVWIQSLIFSIRYYLSVLMKTTDIQIELRNYKIREGYLYKRSRIMREWRKRWIVLTINFLFSFQTDKCVKPTQVIDLKEVVSLRSMVKQNQDIFSNCFHVQTKSHDFAIAAKETDQKWSWIVTFQRLFDFKERGTSYYNSIDQIRTEGFQSQNQFEYRRKNNIKTVTKIKNLEEQCKKRQQKAGQILQRLLDQQLKINIKQEQLLKMEMKLQKQQMFFNERKQSLEIQLQVHDNKKNRSKMSIASLKQSTQQNIEKNPFEVSEVSVRQKQYNLQLNQTMKFIRSKCVQYIFDQFHSDEIKHYRQQLPIILQFLLKIAQKESYKFRPMLSYQIHNHKYLKNFINYLLNYGERFVSSEAQEIKRFLIIFKMIFSNIKTYEELCGDTALELICRWISHFTLQTDQEIILQAIYTLKQLICHHKGNLRSKLVQKLTYLRELSEDSQNKKLCQQMLSGLRI